MSSRIIRKSKSVLVYALHSLEYVVGLAQFRVFVLRKKNKISFIGTVTKVYIHNNNNIILTRISEIGQDLGRILSCGVRKPEQI